MAPDDVADDVRKPTAALSAIGFRRDEPDRYGGPRKASGGIGE